MIIDPFSFFLTITIRTYLSLFFLEGIVFCDFFITGITTLSIIVVSIEKILAKIIGNEIQIIPRFLD